MESPTGTELSWSPADRRELGELSSLLIAIEEQDQPTDRHSLSELQEAYDEEGSEPGHDLRFGRDVAGALVAYGWVHPIAGDVDPRRTFLSGGVHPRWRRRGIGTAVLRWQLERSRSWYAATRRTDYGPLQATIYADAGLTEQLRLYERLGFRALRWFADLSLHFADLPEGLPNPVAPAGFVLRPYREDLSERVRHAHNDAFADHWGAQPVTAARWREQLAAASARPEWSWVALADSGPSGPARAPQVVGYAMNSAYQQDWSHHGFKEGWTDRLGVCRVSRGRGLAQALLVASMHSFADAGMDAAGLGVDADNPDRAFRLYQKLGYRAGGTAVSYGRTERL